MIRLWPWCRLVSEAERVAIAALQLQQAVDAARKAAKQLGIKVELLSPGGKRMFLVPPDLWQSGCQRSLWVVVTRWEAGRVAVLTPCGEPVEGVFEDNLYKHLEDCRECAKKLGTRLLPRPTGGP